MLLGETPVMLSAPVASAVRLALLLVTLAATNARAQNADSAATSPRIVESDLRLRPGAAVHIDGPSTGEFEGTLVRAAGLDGVYASSCGSGSDFPCSGQAENYARAGIAFGLTGAAVGAIIGGLRSRWALRWP